MNYSNDEGPVDPERFTVEFLTQFQLDNAPEQLSDLLRLGALPHWLDEDVASVLFSEYISPDSVLAELQKFRFISQAASGQFTYHRRVREYILALWPNEAFGRFREISARLAVHYHTLMAQPGSAYKAALPEYLYHLLAADPLDGIAQWSRSFENAVEAREIGLAERILAVAEERRASLGDQVGWIDYGDARLALARFEIKPALPTLSALIEETKNPLLIATAHRALGQGLVQNKQWSEAIVELRGAISTFRNLRENREVGRTFLALGDAYRDLAVNSGGIYEEQRDFTGKLHSALYVTANLPFLIYRQIADRVDAVPKLYGANYQNWIVLRLLRSAADMYRKAERSVATSTDEHLRIEVQQRLADVDLELGRHRSAERRYSDLRSMSLVLSSPYRNACIGLGMARLAHLRKDWTVARRLLIESLRTFTQMGAWSLAGEASYLLGQLSEKEHRLIDAVDAYTAAIEYAAYANDGVLRTRIASTFNRLLRSPECLSVEGQERERGEAALDQIDEQIFVTRFPGRIQRWFTGISRLLTGPVLFVLALVLAALFGITPLLLEGSIRNQFSTQPVPKEFIDSITIVVTAFVPFYALWIRHLLYVFIGLLVTRVLLTIASIERSKPQIFILTSSGIEMHDGSRIQAIAWNAVESVVIADRFAWKSPDPLLSKTIIVAGDQCMIISGATQHYRDIQQVIEVYTNDVKLNAEYLRRCNLGVFNHWWLWFALIMANALAAIMVFRFGVYQLYCPTLWVDGVCPDPIHLVIAPWAMWTSILFVLIFSIGTLVRSIKSGQCVRRAIALPAQQDIEQ